MPTASEQPPPCRRCRRSKSAARRRRFSLRGLLLQACFSSTWWFPPTRRMAINRSLRRTEGSPRRLESCLPCNIEMDRGPTMRSVFPYLIALPLIAALAPPRAFAHDLLLSTVDIAGQSPRAEITVRTPLSHLARLEHAPGQSMTAVEINI